MNHDEFLLFICFVIEMEKTGDIYFASFKEDMMIQIVYTEHYYGKTIEQIYHECFGDEEE